jgi:hypothetical protein
MLKKLLKSNRVVRAIVLIVITAMCLVVVQIVDAASMNEQENSGFSLELESEQVNFSMSEMPVMEFQFSKERYGISKVGAFLKGIFIDEYKDMDVAVEVVGMEGEDIRCLIGSSDVSCAQIEYQKKGKFTVYLDEKQRQFRPGKHTLRVTIQDNDVTSGETINFTQDFTWGVLAFNTNKSIYLPRETAYLQMGVLDDLGHTICSADLFLEITAPDRGIAYLNTNNGLITKNTRCGPDNIINTPDYYAYYDLAGTGVYWVKLIANTENGIREINDQFEVRDFIPFEIERIGPTRINPAASYEMKFKVKANKDYVGSFIEYVPNGFRIIEHVSLLAMTRKMK